jgi:chromosome segregation ATPase
MNSTKAQIFAALEANQAEVTKLRAAIKFEQDNAELISEQWHEMNDANEELKFEAQVWRSKAEELQQQLYDIPLDVSDLARELEMVKRQLADATTQVGILMSQLEASNQRAKSIEDDRDALAVENERLESAVESYAHRCDALEELVSTKQVAQPQRQATAPKTTASTAVVESAPTIEVTDFDRAMWRKFQELPRETRLEIIAFARPEWGHVGIHNIVEIRAAWHNAKPISA